MSRKLNSYFFIFILYTSYTPLGFCGISRSTSIEVYLEKNNFFEYSITNISFYPDYISLNFDQKNKKFFNAKTELEIETNINSFDNNPYTLSYQEVLNVCTTRSYNEKNIVNNWVKFKLDGTVFQQGIPVRFSGFSGIRNGLRYARHQLDLEFNHLEESYVKCTGSMTLVVEFDI
ncbi:hypothetical protein I6M33_18430 [Shewanella algae]|nr:hypothetical protein [Shewanella algae]